MDRIFPVDVDYSSYLTKLFYMKLFCYLCLQLAEIVNQGRLISDEIIIDLLSKRLEAGESKGESGFILDGFPRTIRQAVSSTFVAIAKMLK